MKTHARRDAARGYTEVCSVSLGLLLLGATSVRAAEAARRVEVRVVEVAGGRAYLSPGGDSEARVGDAVHIGNTDYPVLAVNRQNLVIALGARRLDPGQRGFVLVHPATAKTFETRALPRPLTAFEDQWRPPALPADNQTTRFVPLGVMSDTRRNRAAFMIDYQRIEPLSGQASGIGRTRLRAILHTELSQLPLSLDADAYTELWQAADLAQRPQNGSRPLLTVQQLELGYRGETLQAAVGRLRYASSTSGALDGARVSAALSDHWAVGAFGGELANPLDGSFDTDASRFGAEVSWQDARAAARPRASLTFQGSRYLGRSDERHVTGLVEAYPEFGRLGAHAEVSAFDAGNPWGAASTELTALGADASVRIDSLRFGAAFDMRRPERSLWLAAYLPPGYFCVAQAAAGVTNEPCLGGDQRYAGVLSAAWEGRSSALDTGATVTTTRPAATPEQTTGFVNFRQRDILGLFRLDSGASVSRGSLLESAAFDIGLGASVADDAADVALYYRPSWTSYRADAGTFLEHGMGSRFWWAPTATFDLNGSVELFTGHDADVLLLQLGAAWRPRF